MHSVCTTPLRHPDKSSEVRAAKFSVQPPMWQPVEHARERGVDVSNLQKTKCGGDSTHQDVSTTHHTYPTYVTTEDTIMERKSAGA